MKTRNEGPTLNETRRTDGKPRFEIEKLEERIAPCAGSYTYRGRKYHFHYPGPCGGHK